MSDELVTAKDIAAESTLSPQTIYEWGREGRHGFPRPLLLGSRVAWRKSEVDAWFASRAAA